MKFTAVEQLPFDFFTALQSDGGGQRNRDVDVKPDLHALGTNDGMTHEAGHLCGLAFAIPEMILNLADRPSCQQPSQGYIPDMTTVQEIEKAITRLPPEKLAEFRSWYSEFDAAQWDEQFEGDVKSGKLESLADRALNDLAQKRCKPL